MNDSITPVFAGSERLQKLLVLPAGFVDSDSDRFAGDPAQDEKNRGHFILIVAGNYSLNRLELEDLGDVSGKSLLHLQCHFGMDSLSWAWSEASPSAS